MSRAAKDSPFLPKALCAVLLLLMVASFANQAMQFREVLAVPVLPVGASAVQSVAASRGDASRLFGVATAALPLPSAALKLNLVACFVQSEASRSVALIAVQNQRARRIQVGEEVVAGLRLHKVEARRVLLSHGAEQLALELPQGRAGSVQALAGGEP